MDINAELIKQFNLRLDQTNSHLTRLEEKIDGHETIIKGNGKPGMRTEVSKNTEFRTDTKADIRRILFMGIGNFLIILVGVIAWALSQMPK